ncbi:hypothetical protein MTO96_018344 [Rhipicephalus appendiculatus]
MERALLFIVAVALVHLRFAADTFSGFYTSPADPVALPSGRLVQATVDAWVYPPLTPSESSARAIFKARRNTLGPDRAPEMGHRYAGFTAYIPFSSTTELAFTATGIVRARGSVPSAAVFALSRLGIKDANDRDTGGVPPQGVPEQA